MNDRHIDGAGPLDHPLRRELNNEIHARPPAVMEAPQLVSYMAITHEDELTRDTEVAHLGELAAAYAVPLPEVTGEHLLLDVGCFQVKWERHNEFSTYTFIRAPEPGDAPDGGAIRAVPARWLAGMPGRLLVATHVELRAAAELPPSTVLDRIPPTDTRLTITSQVSDGAWVFTDFLLTDGWSRFLVVGDTINPRQAGRLVQRLVEIETYRTAALLAFPVAKEVARLLGRAEGELADLMDRMGSANTPEDEREVLAHLTRLAAEVERSVARTTFRFGAAAAYYQLVRNRIEELRETRQPGFITIHEFMERRLAPAINTCAAVARRQEDLSGRIARNSQLLRTRVDIELQRQNQELLAQMNRRARLQMRLQETVEGLSVVAITYYGSQLVQYLAKGAKHWLEPLTPEAITAISIPFIAGLLALGLRRLRRALAAEEGGH